MSKSEHKRQNVLCDKPVLEGLEFGKWNKVHGYENSSGKNGCLAYSPICGVYSVAPNCVFQFEVTHWMPLPEPPEDE